MSYNIACAIALQPVDNEVSLVCAELDQHLEAQASANAQTPNRAASDSVVEPLEPVEERVMSGEKQLRVYTRAELPQHHDQPVETAAPFKFDNAVLAGFRIGYRQDAASTAQKTLAAGTTATQTILQMAGWVQEMKSRLSRKEFGVFVKDLLQWAGGEARKYLDIARAFDGFDLSRLQRLEPFTLLKLRSKRYTQVIARLRESALITQQLVQELISQLMPKQQRKKRASQEHLESSSGADAVITRHADAASGTFYYTLKAVKLSEQIGSKLEDLLESQTIGQILAAAASGPQPNEYYRAQLEELKDVVDNARELEWKNRSLERELSGAKREISERDRLIASLKLQMTERASVPEELSPEGRSCLDVGQESEAIQHSAEQSETEATQATHNLESALEDDLLASVPQKEPVEEAITTMAQDSISLEPIEDFNATTVPQSPDSELVESGSTTTVCNDAVASERLEPASLLEASNDASTAFCQSTTASWEQLKLIRDGESYLQTIDTQIQEINSKLSQPGLDRQVERELKGILTNQLKLRLTKISQIVSIASNNGIPADYEMLRTQGRFVLTSEYASNLLRQAKSWSDVVLIVGGDRAQLLQIVQHWTREEKQLLVHLLITFLETEPDALNEIDWLPQKLLYRALSGLSFTLQKLRQSDNLVDEPEFEYLRGCKFESLEKLGTPREHWVFRLGEKLVPMFGRSDFIVEKF